MSWPAGMISLNILRVQGRRTGSTPCSFSRSCATSLSRPITFASLRASNHFLNPSSWCFTPRLLRCSKLCLKSRRSSPTRFCLQYTSSGPLCSLRCATSPRRLSSALYISQTALRGSGQRRGTMPLLLHVRAWPTIRSIEPFSGLVCRRQRQGAPVSSLLSC